MGASAILGECVIVRRRRKRTRRGGRRKFNQSSGMRRMSVHGMLLRCITAWPRDVGTFIEGLASARQDTEPRQALSSELGELLADDIEPASINLLTKLRYIFHSIFHPTTPNIAIDTLPTIHHKQPTTMARTARLSGLQRDVLSLYRRCLRAARLKPTANRPNFEAFARREFARYITLDKKDFGAIEFLLRKGQKQLEVYEAPGIRNIAG
jgi:succinate dehydrogenase assembly factor 1